MSETTSTPDFPEPSDGVEIKFSFSADRVPAVLDSFGLREESAKRMRIFFFDALEVDGGGSSLRLLEQGVVLRLRHVVDGPDNSTLKLRPAVAERLTGRWQAGSPHDEDYRVEYDWGARLVLAASLDRRVSADEIEEVVTDERPLREAFSDEQVALLRDCGPPTTNPFDGLHVAGPITARRWDLEVEDFRGEYALRVERWEYEGDRRFVEISLRTEDPGVAAAWRDRLMELLERRHLTPDQGPTKTETVLRDLLSQDR